MNARTDDLSHDDASHLQVLSILYYVFAALDALSLLAVIGGVAVFSAFAARPESSLGHDAEGRAFLVFLFCAVFVVNLILTALHLLTARRLRQRRGRAFCQIVAGLTCLSFPLGTALGVFTFIVLGRPSVRAAFGDPR